LGGILESTNRVLRATSGPGPGLILESTSPAQRAMSGGILESTSPVQQAIGEVSAANGVERLNKAGSSPVFKRNQSKKGAKK
jgi:hypothetical protein